MATGSAPAPARITADALRRMCDANPVGPDGKRVDGTLDLGNADLSQLTFEAGSIDLSDVDFRGASLERCRFEQIPFRGSDLTGADADRAVFSGCDLQGAILRNVRGLPSISSPLNGTVVAGLDLSESATKDSILNAKDWHLARYDTAQLGQLGLPLDHNQRVTRRDFRTYKFLNRDLEGFDFRGAQLEEADFAEANLSRADLTEANLTNANLAFADLSGATVTAEQVRSAKNWLFANVGSDEIRKALKLPPDHTARYRSGIFSGCDFTNFDFRNQQLAGLHFEGAILIDANLSGQNLTGTNFAGAHLNGANLGSAVLKDAKDLVAWQLRGTDVTYAELPPEIGEFKGVEQVGKIAPAAAKQFLAMLAACLYCWLTIASTTDVALILGSATLPLPVVQTPIPIAGFYWFAPLVLITVFLYFQLTLHRMWEALAKLPAILPDGRRLDERVYPWMLVQKVRAYYTPLKKEYTFVPKLENFLGSALAYYATPVTLLAFGYRALVKHKAWLTLEHVLLFTVSLLIATQFRRYTRDTLSGVPPTLGFRYEWRSSGPLVACLAIGVALGAWWHLTSRPANLVDADLSTKPDGWIDGQADISRVKGAKLSHANLEHADMTGAFLVGADLKYADLRGAALRDADLRGADLSNADLRDTALGRANLEGAVLNEAQFSADNVRSANNWLLAHYDPGSLQRLQLPPSHATDLIRRDFRHYSITGPYFRRANLAGANFEGVRLGQADFFSSDLSNAILRGCDLNSAVFDGAKLAKADLRGADLSQNKHLTETQLREAILDAGTKLPPAFLDLIPARTGKKKP